MEISALDVTICAAQRQPGMARLGQFPVRVTEVFLNHV